jgi:hypothetical protein
MTKNWRHSLIRDIRVDKFKRELGELTNIANTL